MYLDGTVKYKFKVKNLVNLKMRSRAYSYAIYSLSCLIFVRRKSGSPADRQDLLQNALKIANFFYKHNICTYAYIYIYYNTPEICVCVCIYIYTHTHTHISHICIYIACNANNYYSVRL
jgi:hypothetical protein